MTRFDDDTHRLILAAEIAGYVHDLGKLHPGFAHEKLAQGDKPHSQPGRAKTNISEDHAKLLEEGRIYPHQDALERLPETETVFQCLRTDPDWAATLKINPQWSHPDTIQADGLGAPLRQHHATGKFPETQLSLLGDIYTFAADIRDSALDKGSGGTQDSAQTLGSAEMADAFGLHAQPFCPDKLKHGWEQGIQALHRLLCTPTAAADTRATRNGILRDLIPIFRAALGETRCPTNDVTLHHHSFTTASFFKAAVAEGALRQDFTGWQDAKGLFDLGRMGRIRYRLLGIRWNWAELTRGLLFPVASVSLSARRREVVAALRRLFEQEAAIANVIYEDDDGILVLAPGFYEGTDEAAAERSEQLFAEHVLNPLQTAIATAIEPLGAGTAFSLFWSEPTLYLTDYAQALGLTADTHRQRHLQAGEATLRALWNTANARADQLMQICPQCGLRPAEAHEHALTESGVNHQALCDECRELSDAEAKQERRSAFADEFGFTTRTFNLETLARSANSTRIALVSVRIDPMAVVSGNALITQLARPIHKLKRDQLKDVEAQGIATANELGDWFERLLEALDTSSKLSDETKASARDLLGDHYWLTNKDGRGDVQEVLDQLLLRESAALPAEWQLTRHKGDQLALFALRKHPSPARLQRLWDDLRHLWREMANEVAGTVDNRLIPLSLDGAGLRMIVAAGDVDDVVRQIEARLSQTFAKVRGGLAAQVSCVIMRNRFPLYLALDTLERMERRIAALPNQRWTVAAVNRADSVVHIDWNTRQGEVRWTVDLSSNGGHTSDHWYPYVMVERRAGETAVELRGPERLTHMSALKPGDVALIPPMTFDFMVLEGSARRHQLSWQRVEDELRRPHWVMGAVGQSPLLLERFTEFSTLVQRSGWDLSKLKGLQGEMIETYEKWVRDVPPALRDTGRQAWQAHVRNMLRRYLPADTVLREDMLSAIIDGRFFDAVEWHTFVPKTIKKISSEAVL